jgi:hypothetical protein
MPVLKTPDANANSKAAPAVSFFTRSCSPVSAGNNFFGFVVHLVIQVMQLPYLLLLIRGFSLYFP